MSTPALFLVKLLSARGAFFHTVNQQSFADKSASVTKPKNLTAGGLWLGSAKGPKGVRGSLVGSGHLALEGSIQNPSSGPPSDRLINLWGSAMREMGGHAGRRLQRGSE